MKLSLIIILLLSTLNIFFGCSRHKYASNQYAERMYCAIEEILTPYCKYRDMKIVLIGPPTHTSNMAYGFLLNSSKRTDLEAGMVLSGDLYQYFYNTISLDPEVISYVNYMKSIYKNYEGVSQNKISFRIDFWDENVDRIKPPYLAQIVVEKGVVTFYDADPVTEKLRPVQKVSLDECIKMYEEVSKKAEANVNIR